MKNKLTAIFALLVVVLFTACNQVKTTPEEDLNSFFSAMQQGDYVTADKYLDAKEEDRFLDDLASFDNNDSAFVKQLQSFTYEILESNEVDRNTYDMKVKVNYPDLIPPFSAVMTKLSILVLTDPSVQSMNDEEINKEVADLLAIAARDMENEIETVEEEYTLQMKKGKENWEIDINNNALVRSITGGLYEQASEEEATEKTE